MVLDGGAERRFSTGVLHEGSSGVLNSGSTGVLNEGVAVPAVVPTTGAGHQENAGSDSRVNLIEDALPPVEIPGEPLPGTSARISVEPL